MPLSVSRSEADNKVKAFIHNMVSRIRDGLTSTIYTTLIAGYVFNITHKQCPQLEPGVIFNRCMNTHDRCVNVNPNSYIHWTWTPKFTTTDEYDIDWLTSRQGNAYIVNAPNFSVSFAYVNIVCAES